MDYACGGHDHRMGRRKMLGLLGGALGGGVLLRPTKAAPRETRKLAVAFVLGR